MSIHPLDDDAPETTDSPPSNRSSTSRLVLQVGVVVAVAGGLLTVISSIAAGPETTRNAAGWLATSFAKIVLLIGVLVMTIGYRWDWLRATFGSRQGADPPLPHPFADGPADESDRPTVLAHLPPTRQARAPVRVSAKGRGGQPAWQMLCLALTLGSFSLTAVIFLFSMGSLPMVSAICLGLLTGMLVSTYIVLAMAQRRMLANFGRGGLCASVILVFFMNGMVSMLFGGFGRGFSISSELLTLPVMTLVIAAFAMFLGEAVAVIDED